MKSEEAIVELKSGKKLRRTNWGSGYYIYLENDILYLAHVGNEKTSYNICTNEILPFSELFKNDWELFDN